MIKLVTRKKKSGVHSGGPRKARSPVDVDEKLHVFDVLGAACFAHRID